MVFFQMWCFLPLTVLCFGVFVGCKEEGEKSEDKGALDRKTEDDNNTKFNLADGSSRTPNSDYELVMLMKGDRNTHKDVAPFDDAKRFSGLHARLNVCLRSSMPSGNKIEVYNNFCVPAFLAGNKALQFVGGYLAVPSADDGLDDDRFKGPCASVCVVTEYSDCASPCDRRYSGGGPGPSSVSSPKDGSAGAPGPDGAGQVFVMPAKGTVSLWPFMHRNLGDPSYSTLFERAAFVVGKAIDVGVRVSALVFVHKGSDVTSSSAERCAKSLQDKGGVGGGKVVLDADLSSFIKSIASDCSDYKIDILTVSSDHKELGVLSGLPSHVTVISKSPKQILVPLSKRLGLSSSELSNSGDGDDPKKYLQCLPIELESPSGSGEGESLAARCVNLDAEWSSAKGSRSWSETLRKWVWYKDRARVWEVKLKR
ncbi:MAG: hypothetical protein OXC44_04810 [Proteobacteria bacterium]|nr:hypothetical protein [Pseudomonadota bacterium]